MSSIKPVPTLPVSPSRTDPSTFTKDLQSVPLRIPHFLVHLFTPLISNRIEISALHTLVWPFTFTWPMTFAPGENHRQGQFGLPHDSPMRGHSTQDSRWNQEEKKKMGATFTFTFVYSIDFNSQTPANLSVRFISSPVWCNFLPQLS